MLEMICDRIAASKTYNRGHYTDKCAIDYFYKEEKNIKMNENLKKFLEEVLIRLSKEGESFLTKKNIYKLYLKYTKKAH